MLLLRIVISLASVWATFFATSFVAGAELKPVDAAVAPQLAGGERLRIAHCLVSLIDDVEVPAEKPGVLTSLVAREGAYLEAGAPIAVIDEAQATLQHEAAQAEAAVAQAKADNPLEVDYAVATHRSAEAEYKIALSANAKQANAVSAVELERLRLAVEQARIKISVTQFDQSLKSIEARGFDAKARLTAVEVRQRKVLAPLAGEIVEVFYRPGEWVEPGKPIVRLVRLDRLRVEGFVRYDEQSPGSLHGKVVRVEVASAGGVRHTFHGRVTFVSPIVQPGGEYRIWAEVENRREAEHWLLRPGLEAELTIE